MGGVVSGGVGGRARGGAGVLHSDNAVHGLETQNYLLKTKKNICLK